MTQIDVALLGFGNVGRAFARYVSGDQRVKIRAAADSGGAFFFESAEQVERLLAHKEQGLGIRDFAPDSAVKDSSEFINSLSTTNARILIESLPTNLKDGQPAFGLIQSALASGINVVTVDKGPLALRFDELKQTALASRARLEYSGATGVRIPDELADERTLEIRGLLNGTTNYILTEMQERNIPFDEALAEAQANGIAEPDPSLDLEGWDTVAKTLILAKSLMGAEASLDDVSRIGIGPQTQSLVQTGRETGRRVRLIGRARIWQGRVRVSVAPKLIGPDSPFYEVAGTSKLAVFRTESAGETLAYARSGRDAISQTIMDDVLRISS